MIQNINVVIVQYGDNCSIEVASFSEEINKFSFAKVHVIRTDNLGSARHVPEVNEAMEFSGYQEGLSRVINERLPSDSIYDPVNVLFLNDTFFSGHPKWFSRFIFYNLASLSKCRDDNISCCYGVLSPSDSVVELVSGYKYYLTTWIFMIRANYLELANFKFYHRNETFSSFYDSVYKILPFAYQNKVNEWLQPKLFLRGWYKSSVGMELSKQVLKRKTMAIYLEHTLPKRLHESGIHVADIAVCLPFLPRFIFMLSKNIDRIFINYLKICFRLSMFLRKGSF